MPGSGSKALCLRLAGRRAGVTARELRIAGLHRETVRRLVAEGAVERVARGVYRRPDVGIGEHHGLAVAAVAVPRGVVCLLSALAFHGIGTQLPHEVWMAVDRRSRRPADPGLPLRIVRFSGRALTDGIAVRRIEGRDVRVYDVPKTLADCFKYRHKIGLDAALEALREAWRAKKFAMDDLERHAKTCRVSRVMRPYLEALVS